MSFKRKYVEPVLIFLTVYAFSVLFFKAGELLSIYAYSYFSSILPSDIISSNPVSDPDAYEAYTLGIALVGTFVGLWLINYISLRLDNAKFEHVISLTDGQYELAEGIKLYFKEFFASDVIAATAIVAIVTVSAAFIPEKLMDYGLIIVFKLGDTLNSIYSPIISAVIAASFSLITRILSIPLANHKNFIYPTRPSHLACAVAVRICVRRAHDRYNKPHTGSCGTAFRNQAYRMDFSKSGTLY